MHNIRRICEWLAYEVFDLVCCLCQTFREQKYPLCGCNRLTRGGSKWKMTESTITISGLGKLRSFIRNVSMRRVRFPKTNGVYAGSIANCFTKIPSLRADDKSSCEEKTNNGKNGCSDELVEMTKTASGRKKKIRWRFWYQLKSEQRQLWQF